MNFAILTNGRVDMVAASNGTLAEMIPLYPNNTLVDVTNNPLPIGPGWYFDGTTWSTPASGEDMEVLRGMLLAAVDARTNEIFEAGTFTSSNVVFSTGSQFQLALVKLRMGASLGSWTWPSAVDSRDNLSLLLLNNQGDLNNLTGDALAAMRTIGTAGSTLKIQLRAMTTKEALLAFADPR